MAAPTPLRDGSAALLRPLERGDKPLVASIWRDLSDLSRRRRFLTPTRELTDEDLAYLTEVDHNRHEAVLAVDEESGRPLGVARYVRAPGEPESAEVAVVVIDEWHGRGLGTALLDALTERARENGIRRYIAYVSPDNEVVLEAIERAGAERVGTAEGDEVEFAFELPSEGVGERLRAALRAAAEAQLEFLAAVARRMVAWRRGS
jgi:RimJ/RimL family protein N-acetyltransferase